MLSFDITNNTEISDSTLVKVAKLSFSMGCLTVLIAECENNLAIAKNRPEKEFQEIIARDLVRLNQYKSQKETVESILTEEINRF